MAPLNEYLHMTKASETSLCDDGETVGVETALHLSLREMIKQRGILGVWIGKENLPRLLGGKSTKMSTTGNQMCMRCELSSILSQQLSDSSTTPTNDIRQ